MDSDRRNDDEAAWLARSLGARTESKGRGRQSTGSGFSGPSGLLCLSAFDKPRPSACRRRFERRLNQVAFGSLCRTSWADTLVLGAAARRLSTALMTLFEAPFWASLGVSGVGEWEVNHILVPLLLGVEHDPKRGLKEAVGMHLFHGTVAGAAWLPPFLPSSTPGSLSFGWRPFCSASCSGQQFPFS